MKHLCSTFIIALLSITLLSSNASAQTVIEYKPETTRILFLVDGSGSMKQEWEGKSKFETAKGLLYHLVDSLEQTNKNIEFAVRVFGHQSPRSYNDCKDSNLEIPFSKKNAENIRTKLDALTPQGHTPIAYSLFLAAQDYPIDDVSTNAIILVTDGIENCEGDPCATAQMLQKKRIALKPYIVGLDIGEDVKLDFDCVGTYFDAKDSKTFNNVVNVVISQALNTTTAQVNLLDKRSKPSITNVEFTLYDHFSGAVMYNFVHTLQENGNPDTLYLDPVGKYDIEVHTIPTVIKRGIELTPGKHNIIALDIPNGVLDVHTQDTKNPGAVTTVVREAYSPNILHVQEDVLEEEYLSAEYDFEMLTLPRIEKKLNFVPREGEREYEIPQVGTLSVLSAKKGILSIYKEGRNGMERFFQMDETNTRDLIKLLPGEYTVVYRQNGVDDSDLTKTQKVTIESKETATLKF